ncbi:MAG: four helix bundle protein [Bacteroidota bacterium]
MNDEWKSINKIQFMESPLKVKSTDFAIRIVKLYQYLASQKNEFVLSKQILRSGTNPGAMVREATNAESGMDFIHKMGIAQKELGETQYWLEILQKTGFITLFEQESLYKDSEEIMKMIGSSILTKKKNLKSDKK